MNDRIYLDHNAATPLDPRILEAVVQYLKNHIGNSSSIHSFGRECRRVLTKSRDTIASYLKVRPDEIIFTSGGTEGANLVLRGLLQKYSSGHIITSNVEHSCVYDTLKEFEKSGFEVIYLEPGEWGSIRPEQVEAVLRADTRLIAIMAANNETGVKSDLNGMAALAQRAGVPFFVDAVAILGKESLHIPMGVSAMSFSGQKIHALQGTGFCFIRKGLQLGSVVTGGGHEFGRRAGTENLSGIVSLAAAISFIQKELPVAQEWMKDLRNKFEKSLQQNLKEVYVNGKGVRLSNTSNLYFSGVDGESLLAALDTEGIAASHGSACSSGALEPSRVLTNMGFSQERVSGSLRFSFSRTTTINEIEMAVEIITRLVKRLRI